MSKIHVRKDDKGVWRDCNGVRVKPGTRGVVYYFGKSLPEHQRRTTSTVSSSRPHVSKNLAVHADQAKQFNKEATQGVTYDNRGNMHSTSYAAREREARRRGKSFG